jgi:hypothetical protein
MQSQRVYRIDPMNDVAAIGLFGLFGLLGLLSLVSPVPMDVAGCSGAIAGPDRPAGFWQFLESLAWRVRRVWRLRIAESSASSPPAPGVGRPRRPRRSRAGACDQGAVRMARLTLLRIGTTCPRPNGTVGLRADPHASRLDHLTRWLAVNSDPPPSPSRRASMSMPWKNGLIVVKT